MRGPSEDVGGVATAASVGARILGDLLSGAHPMSARSANHSLASTIR